MATLPFRDLAVMQSLRTGSSCLRERLDFGGDFLLRHAVYEVEYAPTNVRNICRGGLHNLGDSMEILRGA